MGGDAGSAGYTGQRCAPNLGRHLRDGIRAFLVIAGVGPGDGVARPQLVGISEIPRRAGPRRDNRQLAGPFTHNLGGILRSRDIWLAAYPKLGRVGPNFLGVTAPLGCSRERPRRDKLLLHQFAWPDGIETSAF